MVLSQIVVFGVISIVIVSYTLFNLLGVRLTNQPYSVTVQLHTGGGIFGGAEVAYRGVEVGRVTSVHLHPDGVTLGLKINHGTKIPRNTVAHIYDLSAVGEQYVDLVPTSPSTDVLHSGDVIPASHTTTPLKTATVLYDLQRFVNSINPHDLNVIGTQGAIAFAGTGPELKALITDTEQILSQLTTTQAATGDLLKNSALLLKGAADHAGDFDTFASSLQALSGTLAKSTPAVTKLINDGLPTTKLVNAIIHDNGSAISVLLGNLATLSDIQVARVPGLKSLLVAVPYFGRVAPRLASNGTLNAVGDLNVNLPLCSTGVPMTSPISGKRTPLFDVNCPASSEVRGAANAPRASAASAQSVQEKPLVSGYDANSGLVTNPDGSQVQLGQTGGQQELFGNDSWKALLISATGG